MPKITRKDQRDKQRKNFLDGVARRPHIHSRTLRRSLEESTSSSTVGEAEGEDGVCLQCQPVLSCYISTFKEMVHSGTGLKKRKRINPTPKHSESDFIHYRDVTQQNEWLRANIQLY